MSQKFIQLDGGKVTLIHHMPFDPVQGLGKSEAELGQMGVLLETIPEPEQREGFIPLPYYTPERGFYYQYEPAPAGPATTADVEALAAQVDYIGMMTEVL